MIGGINMKSNNKLYTMMGNTLVKVSKVCQSYDDTLNFAKTHENMVLIAVNDNMGYFCEIKEIEKLSTPIIKTTEGTFINALLEKHKRVN